MFKGGLMQIKQIEDEIIGYAKTGKYGWTKIYRLMKKVEDDTLYRGDTGTPSFTAWLNSLADKLQVNKSLLWARLKAGRCYTEYEERAKKRGKKVPSLDTLAVSPDSINLCEKIAGNNSAEMDSLIDKVIAGELTRSDLRAAAKAKRAAGGTMPTTRHDRIKSADRTEETMDVTVADIVMALRKPSWLNVVCTDKSPNPVYHFFTEFRIPSAALERTRNIDVMIAENASVSAPDEVSLRGVEIKTDIKEIRDIHEMRTYTDFCDYFYVAIPGDDPELLEAAKSACDHSFGILAVSKSGEVSIVHEPEKLNPAFRVTTLTNCILRNCPKI